MNTNPTATQPETLLPCPFCGSEAILLDDVVSEYDADGRVYHVTCLDSCSIAPGIYGQDSKEEAIRKWNSRPFTEPQAHVLSETLRYVRDQIDGDVDYFDLRDKVDAALKTAAATSFPTPAEQPSSLIADAIAKVREMEAENKRNYEYWKSIASDPTDMGVMKFLCWSGEDSRVIAMLESLAPPERTRVEGEDRFQAAAQDIVYSHEFMNVPTVVEILKRHFTAAAPADNDALESLPSTNNTGLDCRLRTRR